MLYFASCLHIFQRHPSPGPGFVHRFRRGRAFFAILALPVIPKSSKGSMDSKAGGRPSKPWKPLEVVQKFGAKKNSRSLSVEKTTEGSWTKTTEKPRKNQQKPTSLQGWLWDSPPSGSPRSWNWWCHPPCSAAALPLGTCLAIQPESLRPGNMELIQNPLIPSDPLWSAGSTQQSPSHLSSLLSDLDVQKTMLRGAAAQISHHQQLRLLLPSTGLLSENRTKNWDIFHQKLGYFSHDIHGWSFCHPSPASVWVKTPAYSKV